MNFGKFKHWHIVSASLGFAFVAFLFMGMARNGHIQVWTKVFKFIPQSNHPEASTSIRRLWDEFSNAIDEKANVLNEELKKVSRSVEGGEPFTWSNYGHALFYHWPFNAKPKDHKPLMKQLARCRLSHDVEEKCLRIVNDDWEKRRDKCLDTIKSCLGVTKQEDAEAIATIIYDTHILADYIENTRTTPLAPIKELKADLIDKGLKVLAGDNVENKAIVAKIDVSEDSLNNKIIAQSLVASLSECVPKLMKDRFGDVLISKGISIGNP